MIRDGLPTAGIPIDPLPSPFQRPWACAGEPRKRNWKVFTSMPEPPNNQPSNSHAALKPFSALFQGNPFWRTNKQDQVKELSTNQSNAAKAIKMIDSYEVNIVLYTDGSCKGGMEDGGSAVVVTTGLASNPVALEKIQKKGAKYTCSYQEEKEAMVEALKWMKVNQKYSDTVICSDSQSLLTSIDTMSPDTIQISELNWTYCMVEPLFTGFRHM